MGRERGREKSTMRGDDGGQESARLSKEEDAVVDRDMVIADSESGL
jgi:hypothetical protein